MAAALWIREGRGSPRGACDRNQLRAHAGTLRYTADRRTGEPVRHGNSTALIAGATGLVGTHLLMELLAAPDYQRVIVLGRRAPPISHGKLEVCISDFSNLAMLDSALACDDVFCCLGTTQRAAGSRAAFERV